MKVIHTAEQVFSFVLEGVGRRKGYTCFHWFAEDSRITRTTRLSSESARVIFAVQTLCVTQLSGNASYRFGYTRKNSRVCTALLDRERLLEPGCLFFKKWTIDSGKLWLWAEKCARAEGHLILSILAAFPLQIAHPRRYSAFPLCSVSSEWLW